VTDPDSRNMKTPRGYLQGYNAQAATNEQQIVIAAEVTIASSDFGHLEPMVSATQTELKAAGVTDALELVVADAGKRRGARPGWDGGAYAHMRRVLATDRGGELYRKRKVMIEPVFANTKFNRRIDRFQRRGRSAARSEWRVITATHNLLKLHKHQLAAAGA
jgi:DDE family transposase